MIYLQLLSLAILISAIIEIHSEYRGARRIVFIFKPLTMLGIIAMAALLHSPEQDFYKNMVLLALCFSLLGDIFLMLPSDRFIAGLVSFLVAHLFYIAAFWQAALMAPSMTCGVAVLLVMIPVYLLLHKNLGNLRAPVVVYICVIATMVWAAASSWLALDSPGAAIALAGALLFMISDTVLAVNRFRRPFGAARPTIMATYFAAQWLLALSVSSLGLAALNSSL